MRVEKPINIYNKTDFFQNLQFLIPVVFWLEWGLDFHSDVIVLRTTKYFNLYENILGV